MALKDQKDVLIAWINGEDIQINRGNGWSTCEKFGSYDTIRVSGDCEYRIKPKEIVTTTYIQFDKYNAPLHRTFSQDSEKHNLRLTWAEDGEKLLKAEVI
jgi:hypothetical protein